jgi:hypothetical protein
MGESGEAMATRWQSVRGRRGLRSSRLRKREGKVVTIGLVGAVRQETLSASRRVAGMRLCGKSIRSVPINRPPRPCPRPCPSMRVPLCDHHSSNLTYSTYSSAPSLYNNNQLRRFDWNVRHQQALFTYNSSFHPHPRNHGHLPSGLRLHHKDGVDRGRRTVAGSCQDEDSVAG